MWDISVINGANLIKFGTLLAGSLSEEIDFFLGLSIYLMKIMLQEKVRIFLFLDIIKITRN